jgi:hypothetical protein
LVGEEKAKEFEKEEDDTLYILIDTYLRYRDCWER